MRNLAVKRIGFVLLVCFAFVNTEVTIENGGYSVLVSFSRNVKSTAGWDLLEKMKESLQEASSILHGAIGLQFTKVTFEIPEYWNISQTENKIHTSRVPNYAKSDFLIDDTNDVIFGKFPYAQQYGGCGIPGHQITIPTAFFSDDNKFPRGTALAREWLKYRYGVFDENGYKDDPLYPLYRLLPLNENSELRVTDCTNNPVAYDRQGEGEAFSEDDPLLNPSSKEAQSKVVPDKNSLENVTSSIMYFHQDIPDLLHICGKDSHHPHNELSPNKHNAMCQSQSIWKVVSKSKDFSTDTDPKEYRDIEFLYAKERRLKIVIAWENTLNVGENKGKMICNTIKRFAYELPQGTKFNAFPFSDTLSSAKDYTLKELNDLADKNAIMADIMSDFVKPSSASISIAVDKAIEILRSDSSNSEPEGTIIVISKEGEGISSTLSKIKEYNVCLKVLNLSERNTSHQAEYYNSASPCGFPEDISTVNNEAMFNQLFASMEAILPATVDDKITETVRTGYLSQDTSISFQVDETVEKVTFWMLTKRELENFEMKFNQRIETLQAMKTTTDIMALSFNPNRPESGSIEIAYPHQTDPIFTQVRVTLKADKYLNGFLYTHDTNEDSSDQMPVIIYAVIRYGAYPVQNAKVTATIERPNDDSSIVLEMLDDGRGDPDITENDGVYSRYFTQFNTEGDYSVNVKVEITDLTLYGVDQNADYLTCCGSFLETATSKVKGSSKYFKTFFKAKSGRPDIGYKPSRITDLRIDDVSDDKIVLKWSAPGEEGDTGTVDSYDIKLYTTHEDARKGEKGIPLNKTISPLERGEIQTLELAFSDFEEPGQYYLTLSAKNKRQSGEASPILEIIVPDKQTTTATPDPDNETNNDGSAKTAGSEKRKALIIGLVVGVIVLLILIILVVYFVVVKPKRKEAKAEPTPTATERGENQNHVIHPISFVSADTLIRHHKEKTLARRENKEPPIFREEDFDDTASSQTTEFPDNNNTQQPAAGSTNNEERLPPKSPKKTTYV